LAELSVSRNALKKARAELVAGNFLHYDPAWTGAARYGPRYMIADDVYTTHSDAIIDDLARSETAKRAEKVQKQVSKNDTSSVKK
jgi:hypothetical protein